MIDKIYEYKDDSNWFIGKWGSYQLLTSFDEDADRYNEIYSLLTSLELKQEDFLQIHVAKCDSEQIFLSFVLDMINDNYKRQLKTIQHKGAILVTEGDKILSVHLPKEGVSSQDFFGQAETGFGDTIIIATRNEGKTKEFREMFEKLGVSVHNLNDFPDLPEVEETGMTFEENARLKAETISNLTGKMVLSDDSGLKVDVLGGLPGVWSARFAGPEATDEDNNYKLLHELAMVFDQEKRSAQFHTTLVVAAPDKESLVVEADWEGYIGTEPKGEHGFGYDPLFLVGETGKTAAQLTAEEKNAQSHRGLAMKKLMEVFPSWLNKN